MDTSVEREKGSATAACPVCGNPVGVDETRADGSQVLAKCQKRSGAHAAPETAAAADLPREQGTDVSKGSDQ